MVLLKVPSTTSIEFPGIVTEWTLFSEIYANNCASSGPFSLSALRKSDAKT